MIKSGKLEQLCISLYEAEPDWDRIIERFKDHPQFNPNNEFTLQQYGKYFSEIHLDLIVEKAKKEHPEWNICLTPIKEKDESDNYAFYSSIAGRVFTCSKETGLKKRKFQEYDKVISVDGLPVVFEIKLTKWFPKKVVKQKRKDGTIHYRQDRGIKNSLRSEVYNKRLKPVRELFKSDVSYVMIIPKDMYLENEPFLGPESVYNLPSLFGKPGVSIYNNFKNDNGIITPFYTDRADFREEVLQKLLLNKLKLKIGRSKAFYTP